MDNSSKPILIPVAGGKGGVGKSFVAANLAIALARKGHSTIAVDLDLGGSNLHSLLGIPNRYSGIGDFLKTGNSDLSKLLVDTGIDRLSFIPGDGRTPFLANITWHQKERLLAGVPNLPAEYIILDLGAGTAFNILDFFAFSSHGLVVTTPEYPAVMSMMAFLKNFVLRLMEREAGSSFEIKDVIYRHTTEPMGDNQTSVKQLLTSIQAFDPDASGRLGDTIHAHRPRVVFNMGMHPDELGLAPKIEQTLADTLSLGVDFFGFLFDDPNVKLSVRQRIPLLTNFPESPAAIGLDRMADRILRFWDRSIPESASRLARHVREIYAQMNT